MFIPTELPPLWAEALGIVFFVILFAGPVIGLEIKRDGKVILGDLIMVLSAACWIWMFCKLIGDNLGN